MSGPIVAPVADGGIGHDHLVSVVWVQNLERARTAVSFPLGNIQLQSVLFLAQILTEADLDSSSCI
jgi:hypothetical protein